MTGKQREARCKVLDFREAAAHFKNKAHGASLSRRGVQHLDKTQQ
jgi:hypothetical protein